jgi:hypothetical protein
MYGNLIKHLMGKGKGRWCFPWSICIRCYDRHGGLYLIRYDRLMVGLTNG